VHPADTALMRRLLVLVLVGAALALVTSPAHAHLKNGRVDTWLRHGDTVVGREQVDVSPTPRLTMSISPGTVRIVKWRISNLRGANEIYFRGCQGDAGIGLRYFTPNGEPISWKVTHGEYSVHRVPQDATRTVEVRVHALQGNSSLRCALRGWGDFGVDRVILKVRT